MFMVIGDSILMISIATNHSSFINSPHFLRAWRRSRSGTLHNGMCEATIPVVKEICVTSQWRQVGDALDFDGDFEHILS